MKRKNFTESKILSIIRQYEGGDGFLTGGTNKQQAFRQPGKAWNFNNLNCKTECLFEPVF